MFAKKLNPFTKKQPQHVVVSSISNANTKKLWRLPHVFSRMLELPFPSDADVSIEETAQFFRFVTSCNQTNIFLSGGVCAHAIEILPGITKIVIKRLDGGDVVVPGQQERRSSFSLDLWRFRLPPCTQPERVTAVCIGGKLVVTVPKTKG
ncbi:unnamed protein product [Lathyrus sativus]|nr:unnamed protein product [Lathyrus sativus]